MLLYIFDVFSAHRTDSFLKNMSENNIKVRFVPASCTSELQPLDVSGNDEFKKHVKMSFVQRYADNVNK